MLRKHQEFYFQILQIIDAGLLLFALYLAHNFRVRVSDLFDLGGIARFNEYGWMLILILPLGPFILERQGFYRLSGVHSLSDSLRIIAVSVLILLGCLMAFAAAFHVPQGVVSRVAFILFIPLSIILLGLREMLFRSWLNSRGRSVFHQRHMLVCGTVNDRKKWLEACAETPGRQFAIAGEIDLRETPLPEFIQLLHERNIDVVVFTLEHALVGEVSQALLACEAEGIEAWISADFFGTTLAKPQFDAFSGHPLMVFRSTPDASWPLLAKRFLDTFGALVALILLSLFVLLPVTVAIAVTSGFPIIFSQRRSGIYGRPFTMYKFRSMVTNAEQVQAELMAQNQMAGPVFKVQKDPRVTKVGAFLRKFSLDELPQLWNILRGEMSFVGPRPLPLYETQNFSDFSQRRRMSVRPGLTCLWQIGGRNEIKSFDDWVRLDLEYIDSWSLSLDLWILWRTIPVVLFGKGAH